MWKLRHREVKDLSKVTQHSPTKAGICSVSTVAPEPGVPELTLRTYIPRHGALREFSLKSRSPISLLMLNL